MKGNNSSYVFTLMVDNEFGVLTRITALIRRAGWNIRSLAVAETALPEVSRLTVCLECRHHSFHTVLERLGRQSCVREITVFERENQVARELAILRVCSDDEMLLERMAEECGVELIDQSGDGEYLYSVCCDEGELDKWLPKLKKIGLVELARTGTIAMNLSSDSGEEGKHEGE